MQGEGRAAPAEFVLPECNAFLRRAFYEELESSFPDCVVESREVEASGGSGDGAAVSASGGGAAVSASGSGAAVGASGGPSSGGARPRRRMVVMQMSDAQKDEREAKKHEERLAALGHRAGFLRIWRALGACAKPIIGHNCLYDLLFMYSAFVAPLPATLADFKTTLSRHLGEVYDTKMLALDSGLFADTMLAPLHLALLRTADEAHASKCVLGEGGERYEVGQCEHEAGYDAHLTGSVFAMLRARGHAPDRSKGRLHLNNSLFTMRLHEADDALTTPDACVLHVALVPQPRPPASLEEPTKPDEAGRAAITEAPPVRTHELLAAMRALGLQARVRWVGSAEAFVWLEPKRAPPPADAAADTAAKEVVSSSAIEAALAQLTQLGLQACTVDQWCATQSRPPPEVSSSPAPDSAAGSGTVSGTAKPCLSKPEIVASAEPLPQPASQPVSSADDHAPSGRQKRRRTHAAAAPDALPDAEGRDADENKRVTRRSKRLAS